jgi:hypothetical protein
MNITFDNILNVVSGRITSKRLNKALNHYEMHDSGDENLDDNNTADDYISIQMLDPTSPPAEGKFSSRRQSSPMGKHNASKFTAASTIDESRLEKSNREVSFHDKDSDGENKDQLSKDKPSEAIEKQTQTSLESDKNKAGVDFFHPKQPHKNVDDILKEISDLKEAKRNSLRLPNTLPTSMLRQEFNNKIEQKLANLLLLIMDDQVAITPQDLKENLKIVIKDINKLQGKVIDGHLKTKLLFQFLKEFRKIQEENQRKGDEGSPGGGEGDDSYAGSGNVEKSYSFDPSKQNNSKLFFETVDSRGNMSPNSDEKRRQMMMHNDSGYNKKPGKVYPQFQHPSKLNHNKSAGGFNANKNVKVQPNMKNKLNNVAANCGIKHTELSLRRAEEAASKKRLVGQGQGGRTVKNDKWIGKKNDMDLSDDDWVPSQHSQQRY